VAGLREKNKALRTQAIFDAAVELLDNEPLDEVTTERIAARAGVSPATVYNLVGTRSQLLRGLTRRVVEDLVDAVAQASARDDDPVDVAELIVDQSVAAFTEHSRAFRRIVAAGRTTPGDDEDRIDASQLQVAALRRAQELGILRADVDPAGLGRQVYISWIGAMEHWAGGALDDEGFAVATRHGLFAVLAAAAGDPHRDRFLAELGRLGLQLERHWAG